MKNNLSTGNGLLLKDSCIVIPTTLRKFVLSHFHEEHSGTSNSHLTTCTLIYWSGIDEDVENFVKQCQTCIKLRPTKLADSFINKEVPHNL